MPNFFAIAASLREQMQANLTRSDILRALIFPTSIFMTGLIANIYVKGPREVTILLCTLLTLCFLVYMLAFVYCLFNDRDALRSEKYNVSKMAIEHGVYGDSSSGLLEPPKPEASTNIQSSKEDK